MKKTVTILVGVTSAAGIAALVCIVLYSTVGQMILGFAQIKQKESALCQPGVYEPVAKRLAIYCQSDQSLFPYHLTYAWLPEELANVGHGWGSLDTKSAHIEMGGGFHHYGYSLSLDKSRSTATTNVWTLDMYSEGSSEHRLTEVRLPKTAQLSADALLDKVIGGYDAAITRTPGGKSAYRAKIETYLWFDRVPEARQVCVDMLTLFPDDWWTVLVNALLQYAGESNAESEELIISWVEKTPNFFRYLDLAYFYQLTDQPTKSADAVTEALKFDANTDWGHGTNSEHRGYAAAMYAYESGQFEVTKNLCQKLERVTVNGRYAKRGLATLRRAAESSQNGEPADVEWDDAMSPFDPFEPINIEKLLGRELNLPTKPSM